VPIIRGSTSRGAHVRVLHLALWAILDLVPDDPVYAGKRVALRNTIAALRRAYPGELDVNDVDLEQWLAEEDGDEISTKDP